MPPVKWLFCHFYLFQCLISYIQYTFMNVIQVENSEGKNPERGVSGAQLEISGGTAGAYPGFSEGGGRDPPKKLTSQTSVRLS